MSPVDVRSLGSARPRTLDGRTYPEHLRPFEIHDQVLLPKVAQLQPVTFDKLSVIVEDPRLRAVLPQWLASAEWRGLIERVDPAMRSSRQYRLGPYTPDWLSESA
jgi:hypothetical protein